MVRSCGLTSDVVVSLSVSDPSASIEHACAACCLEQEVVWYWLCESATRSITQNWLDYVCLVVGAGRMLLLFSGLFLACDAGAGLQLRDVSLVRLCRCFSDDAVALIWQFMLKLSRHEIIWTKVLVISKFSKQIAAISIKKQLLAQTLFRRRAGNIFRHSSVCFSTHLKGRLSRMSSRILGSLLESPGLDKLVQYVPSVMLVEDLLVLILFAA